jgi:2-oxoglutarate ferredoxin oxidoreductase subunit alpha
VLDHAGEITFYGEQSLDDAEIAVFAFGVVARAAAEAVRRGRAQGLKLGLFHAITLWPFPAKAVIELSKRVRAIVVAEMNLGQMVHPLTEAVGGRVPVHLLSRVDGKLIDPDQILEFARSRA